MLGWVEVSELRDLAALQVNAEQIGAIFAVGVKDDLATVVVPTGVG